MMKDYAGNTIIDSTFEDKDLPHGIGRTFAHAIIIENADKRKVETERSVRNWKRDGGGRGTKPIGPLYEHNGKWRQKFVIWDLWKFER